MLTLAKAGHLLLSARSQGDQQSPEAPRAHESATGAGNLKDRRTACSHGPRSKLDPQAPKNEKGPINTRDIKRAVSQSASLQAAIPCTWAADTLGPSHGLKEIELATSWMGWH